MRALKKGSLTYKSYPIDSYQRNVAQHAFEGIMIQMTTSILDLRIKQPFKSIMLFDMTYAVKFLGSYTSKVLYIASDLAPVGQYEAAGQSVGWAPAAP